MIVSTHPEFGIELACVIPYAYYLHKQGQLEKVITSTGMRPFYYFCDNVEERYRFRTIDNASAGMNTVPNNWIHGINPLEEPGVLNYEEWECPPYKQHYNDGQYDFEICVVNKYNREHDETPTGFFDVPCLANIFQTLRDKGYTKILYKREKLTSKGNIALDHNEFLKPEKYPEYNGHDDYDICEHYGIATLAGISINQPNFNEIQLRAMASCDKFITVCGGNSILCALFGGTVISYVQKGKELRPNYFGPNSYFRRLANSTMIPVFDCLAHVNKNTYHHKPNFSGKNNYDELLETIDRTF